MVKNRLLSRTLLVLALVIGYVGFRFVTQAGQGFAIQNDGYAGTGGVMILLSGLIIGLLVQRTK